MLHNRALGAHEQVEVSNEINEYSFEVLSYLSSLEYLRRFCCVYWSSPGFAKEEKRSSQIIPCPCMCPNLSSSHGSMILELWLHSRIDFRENGLLPCFLR